MQPTGEKDRFVRSTSIYLRVRHTCAHQLIRLHCKCDTHIPAHTCVHKIAQLYTHELTLTYTQKLEYIYTPERTGTTFNCSHWGRKTALCMTQRDIHELICIHSRTLCSHTQIQTLRDKDCFAHSRTRTFTIMLACTIFKFSHRGKRTTGATHECTHELACLHSRKHVYTLTSSHVYICTQIHKCSQCERRTASCVTTRPPFITNLTVLGSVFQRVAMCCSALQCFAELLQSLAELLQSCCIAM